MEREMGIAGRISSVARPAKRALAAYGRGLYYQESSADLHVLLIADALARVARARAGASLLRTAYVGRLPSRVLANTEALADSGFAWNFFAGDPQDVMHPSRPLDELDPADFDLVLVADVSVPEERRLFSELSQRFSGYQSGTIVQFGQLLHAHIRALGRIRRGDCRTCLNPRKIAVVGATVALAPAGGIVVECGVYRGGTTVYLALLQQELGISRPVFALDTFAGMPSASAADRAGGFFYDAGMFTDTTLEGVTAYYRQQRVHRMVTPIAGLVSDTLPPIIAAHGGPSFALVDTDQYAGTISSLRCLLPNRREGALVIVDDVTVTGVDTAIREALDLSPGLVRGALCANFDLLS